MKKELQDTRQDYHKHTLNITDVDPNPIIQFINWLKDWETTDGTDFNAMVLSTVNKEGKPSARVVLLKGVEDDGFDFYTNYESRKGEEMLENPNVALTFFWQSLERQVRIEGRVQKLSAEQSSTYFHSRPRGSQIGAWASPQSHEISREELEENVKRFKEKFSEEIPCPPHWGGYKVIPEKIEFWQGRRSRLHDRILYVKEDNAWKIKRLAP